MYNPQNREVAESSAHGAEREVVRSCVSSQGLQIAIVLGRKGWGRKPLGGVGLYAYVDSGVVAAEGDETFSFSWRMM